MFSLPCNNEKNKIAGTFGSEKMPVMPDGNKMLANSGWKMPASLDRKKNACVKGGGGGGRVAGELTGLNYKHLNIDVNQL